MTSLRSLALGTFVPSHNSPPLEAKTPSFVHYFSTIVFCLNGVEAPEVNHFFQSSFHFHEGFHAHRN